MTTVTNPTGPVRVRRWDDPLPQAAANPDADHRPNNEPPAAEPATAVALPGRGRVFWWAITINAIVYTTIAAAVLSGNANPINTAAMTVVVTLCAALMITVDAKRHQQ